MRTPNRLQLLVLFLLLSLAAFSQEIAAHPRPPASRLQLDVVVTPKDGKPVSGLQQKDFTLLDNKIPLSITSFQAVSGSQAPIEVILVIDAVNTTYQNIAYERSQIEKFLRADSGKLAQPTALMIFTDTGTQIQESFSKDGNLLSESLNSYTIGLRTIRRSTGIYGADDRFTLSINALRTLAAHEAPRPGRKIVLWVSPGWPILSGPGIQLDSKQQRQIFDQIVGLSDQLRQARMTLYSINSLGVSESLGRAFYYQQFVKGVTSPSHVDIGDLSLQALAVQTGGMVLNSTDVSTMLHRSLEDTEAYYELTFDPRPAEKGDEYHHLEVHLTQPGLIARARTGYYAQP